MICTRSMAVQGRPIAVSMVGDASRYSAYKLVDSVGSADLIKALERGWGRMLLGPMERLKAEEGKGFCSQQFAAWAQGHDIKLDSVRPWPPKKT